MSTVHSIAASDLVSATRSVLTANFANLNTDKLEAANAAQVLAADINTVAITPSTLGANMKRIYKSSNQTTTSSVLGVDTHLQFPVAANEAWAFQVAPRINGPSVPDFKFTFTAPAGASGGYVQTSFDGNDWIAFGATDTLSTNGVANGEITHIVGIVYGSSVAGSVALVWSQNIHTPSSVTTVLTGSFMIADRMN